MKELTEFQVKCEKKLSRALYSINKKLCDSDLGEITDTYFDHTNETYIHANVDGTDIELWIYDDGAMFTGSGLDMRYEREDYSGQEELIGTFIEELLSAISKIG